MSPSSVEMKRWNLTAVLAAFLLLFLPSHHVMATFLFTYDAAGRLEYTTQGQSFVHDASGNLLYAFHSAAFPQSDQVVLSNLSINSSAGAKHTVEFWMYWDGTNSVMPFAWDTNYSLWLADGYFGFNTGESNIIGISSEGLKNRWVQVSAIFYNGIPNAVDNELYIDGVKQTIGPVKGTTSFVVGVTPRAHISGDAISNHRMGARIGEVRIWNYPMTEAEMRSGLHKVVTGSENGLIGYWKLDDMPRPSTAMSFPQSDQVRISNLAVNPSLGAKHTVEFWMYWDGTNSVMPFAWDINYSLWLADGYFGFNTGEGNILGISSEGLKNRWVHVGAVFYNGVPSAADNELYIDGVKQTIGPVKGTTSFVVGVTPRAHISGDAISNHRMSGRIGEVRIWNYSLSVAELRAGWYKVLAGSETGLIGYWEPY